MERCTWDRISTTPDAGQSAQELARAKELAEQANQAKDRFLAMLSHELRTPLTPMSLAVGELEARCDMPEDVRESLAMIRRNLAIETRLIDDLLDLSRIISGKLRLNRLPVHAHTILEHVMRTISQDVKHKGLKLTTKLEARDELIRGDDARLHQVFMNLLSNAVKFTRREGQIGLRTHNTRGHISIEVQDSGIGISTAALQRLFQP